MAEAHLEGAPAEGQGEQLMAQTDPEDGNRAHKTAQRLDGGPGQLRVTRPVAEEHTVGPASEHLGGRSVRGHHGHGGQVAQAAQDGGLDAQVVGHNPARARPRDVRLGRGDLADEIHAPGSGLGSGRGEKGRLVGGAEGAGHGARIADVAGEAAGVDAGDARNAVTAQEVVQAAGCPPVAVAAGQVAHDHAPAVGPRRLRVGVVGAVVADVGIGEGDDLTRVGRVRDHLLVPAHHRVEDDLSGGDGRGGSHRLALEHLPVAQHQQGRLRCNHR